MGISGGQIVDTMAIVRLPLKTLGYTAGSRFFYQSEMEIRERLNFLRFRLGMGPTGEVIVTYGATNVLLTTSGCGVVLTVFCLPKVGRCR